MRISDWSSDVCSSDLGWLNSIAQLSFFHWWKSISPSVVSAVKFGASSPRWMLIGISFRWFVFRRGRLATDPGLGPGRLRGNASTDRTVLSPRRRRGREVGRPGPRVQRAHVAGPLEPGRIARGRVVGAAPELGDRAVLPLGDRKRPRLKYSH